jgi:hypothetical protein
MRRIRQRSVNDVQAEEEDTMTIARGVAAAAAAAA